MELELANKRLQLRIKELEQEVITLKGRLSDSQIQLNRAHSKIAEIKEVKVAKQVKKDLSNKIVVISHSNPNKPLTLKQKLKKRQKTIYGILKNPTKYNLSDIEKSFLVSIENTNTLSQKQYDWLESIKKRLK
jgi:septal ring factor EnvC (AmiA/AmiB activator)